MYLSVDRHFLFIYTAERSSLTEMKLLNQTPRSATGIGWTGSWTGWRTCCPFLRRFALVWTSCLSFASAWDTWESRATSMVRKYQLHLSMYLLKPPSSHRVKKRCQHLSVSHESCERGTHADKPNHSYPYFTLCCENFTRGQFSFRTTVV